MGWGVYDYPSAPLEPAGARDTDGECQAKGCGATFTDETERWQCADGQEGFCKVAHRRFNGGRAVAARDRFPAKLPGDLPCRVTCGPGG